MEVLLWNLRRLVRRLHRQVLHKDHSEDIEIKFGELGRRRTGVFGGGRGVAPRRRTKSFDWRRTGVFDWCSILVDGHRAEVFVW